MPPNNNPRRALSPFAGPLLAGVLYKRRACTDAGLQPLSRTVPNEIPGNNMNKNDQIELPLLGEVPGPVDLPMWVIERCGSKEDAVRECWNFRRDRKLTQTAAAEQLGMSKAQFTKLLAGQSGFRGNQERALQYLCANRAIAQYQAWELGCHLVDDTWEEHNVRRAQEAA